MFDWRRKVMGDGRSVKRYPARCQATRHQSPPCSPEADYFPRSRAAGGAPTVPLITPGGFSIRRKRVTPTASTSTRISASAGSSSSASRRSTTSTPPTTRPRPTAADVLQRHYDTTMYFPVLLFDDEGRRSTVRPGNACNYRRSAPIRERVIHLTKARFPAAQVVVCGDEGFCARASSTGSTRSPPRWATSTT